jgi:dCMP deaminase
MRFKEDIPKRPSWDEYFMAIAYLTATRSSCFNLNTGAVITKNNRIIATGYNGAPSGIPNSFEEGYCRKDKFGIDFEVKGTGTCRGRHAEENAMSQPSRDEMNGATIYSVYYPCGSCAKSIVGNDISKVVWSKIYKDKDKLAEELFEKKGIEVIKLELDLNKIYDFLYKLK